MNKKRMADSYEIIRSFEIGRKEIVIGEDKKAPAEERYLVADYETNGVIERYSDGIVSDDFAEICSIFAKRIEDEAIRVIDEKSKIAVDTKPIKAEDCQAVSYDEAIRNKVVVINQEVFKPEYQMSVKQLHLCTGGFGSEKNARGSACFCINLYTGKESRFERRDILGIIEKEKLPQWAKENLATIQKKREERRKEVDAR